MGGKAGNNGEIRPKYIKAAQLNDWTAQLVEKRIETVFSRTCALKKHPDPAQSGPKPGVSSRGADQI